MIENIQKHSEPSALVEIDGEMFYKISGVDQMPEFFMSLVSSGDHWMFISSRGALTAGRRNANHALFPYYSADKLSDMSEFTGSKTVLLVRVSADQMHVWEPFAKCTHEHFVIQRNVFKSPLGNKIWFEEENRTLNLAFRYQWTFGHRFGFIRRCEITNTGMHARDIEVLDGLQNLLPAGVEQNFQLRYSNLCDAYKKSELLHGSGLAVYYLSSIPTDRAEPSEGLRSTTVWHTGLSRPIVLLSDNQLDRFRSGHELNGESEIRGQRGAYLVNALLPLPPSTSRRWTMVADVEADQTDVINLNHLIVNASDLDRQLDEDIANCQQTLQWIAASADGCQLGQDLVRVHRHQSNVLFNVMRGGIPADSYEIDPVDFRAHVRASNVAVYQRNESIIRQVETTSARRLIETLDASGDVDLLRIGLEYLPLTFSRRHGDPTRPWNAFNINVQNCDGSLALDYEGNWRDIFQNWEALGLAYPQFLPNMIFRFVNASTADGYNPYRINKRGFEWEKPDSSDSWVNIGYWGDHQIIYLAKLLEWSRRFDPQRLNDWLEREVCSYANVPYRIRSYEEMLQDSCNTIDYRHDLAHQLQRRASELGSDGKLLTDPGGEILRVSLAEKILVPLLAKISNFVPQAGIWLNTQRPEWNDANNALVGNGASMVTVYYLRRFVSFVQDWFAQSNRSSLNLSAEMVGLFDQLAQVLRNHRGQLDQLDGPLRKQLVDQLSTAGSNFRLKLYEQGLSGTKQVIPMERLNEFLSDCLQFFDHSIRHNRRTDGMYHSYNLISFEDSASIEIQHLPEMLEGQVAVLSCGLLQPDETVDLLDALRASQLYRADQKSYLLYPDRRLPLFHESNEIPPASVDQSLLLTRLLHDDVWQIVRRDVLGGIHFNGAFRNGADVARALDQLAQEQADYADLIAQEAAGVVKLFEQVFDHQNFTGRSGTFFAYEGLGSVYWHMVSKLHVAVQDCLVQALDAGVDGSLVNRLRQHYRDIQSGLGPAKTPGQYGAFPIDPYSHTPRHAGAQQPGMTGQVKEDILTRFGELGVRVRHGRLSFDPRLFDPQELLKNPGQFHYVDLDRKPNSLSVPIDAFAFTVCQIPVMYRRASSLQISVYYSNGEVANRAGGALTEEESQALFSRSGVLNLVEVGVPIDSRPIPNNRG